MKATPNTLIHFWIMFGEISDEQLFVQVKPGKWYKGAAPAGAPGALSTVDHQGGIGAPQWISQKKEVIKTTVVLALQVVVQDRRCFKSEISGTEVLGSVQRGRLHRSAHDAAGYKKRDKTGVGAICREL